MIIQSRRVWIQGRFIPAMIETTGTTITAIHDYGEKEPDIDHGNARIVPGFIDIHTHGYKGFDLNDANEEGLRTWFKEITAEGVTGICPTTITQSHDVLSAALKNAAEVNRKGYEGARMLGIHLEGPYLDMKYKGAQPEENIRKPDIDELEQFREDSGGLLKIVTMACEHDVGFKFTRHCAENGVIVSQGHSGADADMALLAGANGARSFTHVYNGMSGFSHRGGGVVNAALTMDDCFCEVIADGHHCSLGALRVLFEMKGKHRVIMVTDSLNAKGFPAGTKLKFGGNEIMITLEGTARLTLTRKLAGSTLRMNRGLQVLVEQAGIPFEAALNACTCNPAALLGIDDHKGMISVGYDADLTVLNDGYDVLQTYVVGQPCLKEQEEEKCSRKQKKNGKKSEQLTQQKKSSSSLKPGAKLFSRSGK